MINVNNYANVYSECHFVRKLLPRHKHTDIWISHINRERQTDDINPKSNANPDPNFNPNPTNPADPNSTNPKGNPKIGDL